MSDEADEAEALDVAQLSAPLRTGVALRSPPELAGEPYSAFIYALRELPRARAFVTKRGTPLQRIADDAVQLGRHVLRIPRGQVRARSRSRSDCAQRRRRRRPPSCRSTNTPNCAHNSARSTRTPNCAHNSGRRPPTRRQRRPLAAPARAGC